MNAMTRSRFFGLQLLFGWMNLVLAIPSIYLMFGMPLVMRQHGWSGTEIGLFQLAALPAMFKFLFAIPVQRIRLGKGKMVHWLWLLSLGLLALYWAIGRQNLIEERGLLFALTFAISIAATWADIPLNALAVQCLPRSEQLRAGSIRSAALFLGAIIGGGIMILLQARFGWQVPFWLMGLALLCGCLPFAWLRKAGAETPRSDLSPVTEHGVLADWASFFKQPGARQWSMLLLTCFPFIGAAWLYLKPLMLDQGMEMERVAFIVGILGGVIGALFSLIGGRLARSMGIARAITRYLAAALGALALLTFSIWAGLGPGWLIASALCIAASMGAISALMFGLTYFFTRRQLNAADYGLQTTLFTLVRLGVPVLAGLLLDAAGQLSMLLALMLGVLLALFLAFRVRQQVSDNIRDLLDRND